jgi:tetratricopeptide (TPR) repeat protein
MLFSLLQRFLAKDELFAFCVSLIFVSHPLQTNVVTYISGRADALAFFFVLAAFMGYLRFLKLQKRHYAVIAGTSYALALFSKETAAIFIVIPLLYDYTFLSSFQRGQLRLRRFLVYAILLFVSLLYLVMRYLALKSLVGGSYGLYPALVQRLLPMPIVFFRYLWLLLFPYGLSLSHQVFIPGSFLEAKTLTAILAWIVITVFTIISKRYSRIIFFGSAWFLLNLAAITNVLPLNAYMHEAWLYPGLAGFFIALVDLGFQWKRRATVVLLLVALILFSVITIKRNLDYRDPVILYKKTLSQSPGNLKVYHNLGLVYLERGQLDEAIISFKNAIRLKPDLAGSYFALGYSYEKKSELDAARKSYEQALRINPEFSVAREFLMRLNQQDVRK